MLSLFFTIISYLFVGLLLAGYLYVSIVFLFEDSELIGHSINIIIFSFLFILSIGLLAKMGRFDSVGDASELFRNIWFMFQSIWTGFFYAFKESSIPVIIAFFALFTTPIVIFVIVVDFFAQTMKEKGYRKAKREIRQAHHDKAQSRVECQEANKARRETEKELDSVSKDLKKKRLQLAETSSKLLKYTKFWDENKDKVNGFDSKLKLKDSKIVELEEVIKRRNLQIQRLKKSRTAK